MTREPEVRELAQLLRLRGLRVAAATRECAARAQALAEAEAALARRDALVAHWRGERARLAAWLAGEGARDIARFAPHTAARRAHVAEQLEREEYARHDDVRALEDARAALADARARRAREQAREDESRRLLRQAAGAAVVRREAVDLPEAAPRAALGMPR
ncbi:MAG: hypothetical protein ACTHL8_11410 [Burkholderiaceae bacterium]